MKILVTGTTGLVGEAVAIRLARTHQVTGMSRHINPALSQDVNQIQADLANLESLQSATRPLSFDAVVHCAADRNPVPGSAAALLVNCLGTQQIIELARKRRAQILVYLSGVAVIGRPVNLSITEEHPVLPMNEYTAAKMFGEHLTGIAAREGWAAASVLRLTAPVGANMPKNRLLPLIVKKMLDRDPIEINGDGSRSQNYVDVEDVARAVEQVIVQEAAGLFNIAGAKCVSNLELAHLCARVLGVKAEIRLSGRPDPEDGVAWDVSTAKAEETFGYKPLVPLEETIKAIGASFSKSS